MDAASVPITAWQQAVIVVLFILFLGGVFAFVRWILKWTSDTQAKQQADWQSFVAQRDTTWQNWMDAQNESSRETMCEVTDALKALGQKIDAHDEKVEERIQRAVEVVRTKVTGKR